MSRMHTVNERMKYCTHCGKPMYLKQVKRKYDGFTGKHTATYYENACTSIEGRFFDSWHMIHTFQRLFDEVE